MFKHLPEKRIIEQTELQKIKPNHASLERIPRSLAEKTQTCVFDEQGTHVALLTTNNQPVLLQQIIDKLTAQNWKIETWYTDEAWFAITNQRYDEVDASKEASDQEADYRKNVQGEEALKLIKETYQKKEQLSEGAFLTEMIRLTFQGWCSDLHFQAEELGVVMRVRKDGILQTMLVFSHKEFVKYLMKIKYMAKVRMNVESQTQDGRFDLDIHKGTKRVKVDIRVSIMPSLRGESVVLRFLDGSQAVHTLPQLGMIPYHENIIKRHLKKNYGMILVTWPTGSGKTTSVYTMMSMINAPDKKIITFEDPVEYELPWVEQNQINEKKGFTFEEWLKGVLRHDPDIIMVWEIRTLQSAEMAINAALTGHLVISTMHTNTAIEAITRLLNMGVKPYMLAPALNLVVWQRLVRQLDEKEVYRPQASENEALQAASQRLIDITGDKSYTYKGKVYMPAKDASSWGKGYEWRLGVYECFELSDELKQMLLQWASTMQILQHATESGYLTMREDGYGKVIQWLTSIPEVERVI